MIYSPLHSRIELVIKINCALRLVHVTTLLDLLYLRRIGSNESAFGRAGDNLNVYVVLASKKQALSDRELAEALFFFAGQLKNITQNVDGGRRLLEQKLH